MKYQLLEPVEIFNQAGDVVQRVEELDFREKVKMKDMRGIQMRETPMSWDEFQTIAGRLCCQTDLIMGEISFADAQQINILVGGFLEAGQKTQTKLSH